ncbi:type II/IV secretion system protein [Candidatus Parcubacteria bacterium]|nr:MAG: type II/IV secretion system protein [Candidatus Parcubacteria bacterium]
MKADKQKINRSRLPKLATREVQEKFRKKISDIMIKDKEQEARNEAALLGTPYISLYAFPISPETLITIAEPTAARLKTVCFFRDDNGIKLGSVNPADESVENLKNEIFKKTSKPVTVFKISEHSFNTAFRLYSVLPKYKEVITGVEIKKEEIERFEKELKTFKDLSRALSSANLTDMLSLIIAGGLKVKASDIHIEAESREIKVRYRIDGFLHNAATIEKSVWTKIIARIKLTSRLKINVTDRPQDGRFTIFMTDEQIDVRVSTVPTAYGESVVMRILMSSKQGMAFEDLGLRGKAFVDLEEEIKKPNGMIIATGPTGSGKTTMLYAILLKLSTPGNKILTLEDPVEYRIPGISQSQVDPAKNYTFASGLRSLLRQDPDIIMVGEVRDLETADISINAALTGHLVATTLHTNDSSGAIPRLIAMGVKNFLLPPALNAIIGQRLVRRICAKCKVETELDNKILSEALSILSKIPDNSGSKPKELHKIKFYKGRGCTACQGIGYKGRIGIFEVMSMVPEYEPLILSGQVSEYDLKRIALKNGMVTMVQDGLLKAIDGITSVEEVFRVAKDISGLL